MRPTVDETFLAIAEILAKRATCKRRSVGCVIVDRDNNILATGYNGTPRRAAHCADIGCDKLGTDISYCNAIHAEQNAIARLQSPSKAYKLYCTTEPCEACAKLIAATSIQHVLFLESYKGQANVAQLVNMTWSKYDRQ